MRSLAALGPWARRSIAGPAFFVVAFFAPSGAAPAAADTPVRASAGDHAPAVLSERAGEEIDADERARYRLFPDLHDFASARFEHAGRDYRLTYVRMSPGGAESRTVKVPRDAFEQTAWHVAFTEENERLTSTAVDSVSEPDVLRRTAVRYAARGRYDVARVIAADLRADYASSPAGAWAVDAGPRLDALAGPRRALIWPGSMFDRRGRTDLLVFSGYYGLWLGIAIPVALDASDEQAYAAGLLAVPAASVLLASTLTKDANITRGQATIISLGGNLGTFQGLGWSGTSDADGRAVVGAGVLAGLGGIALAIPLANTVHFTEGHAEIMSSAMWWGGWYGLIESTLTDRSDNEENSPLVDMLVGSDAGVLIAGVAAHGARLSKGRMRLINLSGVLGTAFGGGMALLVQADDDKTTLALLGAGSTAGLILGAHWTRRHDVDEDLGAGPAAPETAPALSLAPQVRGKGCVPTLAVRLAF